MPRKKSKQSASGDFDSAFDDDLDDIQTPVDSLGEDFIEPIEPSTNIPAEKPLNISTKNDISNKFGLKKNSNLSGTELVPRTYKVERTTVDRLESLVYKDSRRNKKIPGTKGFISDFIENAIWQHLFQLGLATEDEVNSHLKDYSKYPLNLNLEDEQD